jgi:hypothetical protein
MSELDFENEDGDILLDVGHSEPIYGDPEDEPKQYGAFNESDHPRDAGGQFSLEGWDKVPEHKESIEGQQGLFGEIDVAPKPQTKRGQKDDPQKSLFQRLTEHLKYSGKYHDGQQSSHET